MKSIHMNQNRQHITLKTPLPVKSLWQKKEPEDRSDPVPHEASVCIKYPHMLLTGTSIRGRSHAHLGKWREDVFSSDQSGSFLIFAVADGTGACPLSRVGAKIACETAVDAVKKSLSEAPSDLSETFVRAKNEIAEFLKNGIRNAVSALKAEAQKRNTEADQLSTTLMLAVYRRMGAEHLIGTFQIGDGVVAVREKSKGVSIFGKPDFGKYAGQSVTLTSPEIMNQPDSRITISLIPDLLHMAMMTDGISDDYFPLDKGMPFFFEEMDKIFKSGQPLEGLKKWIRYEKAGSHDDRTVLLLSVT